MRYLKLASAKNPDTDFILLNGGYFDKEGNKNENFNMFEGFLCTNFQTIGISRKLEFLEIKNRQFIVENKQEFKKYNLTIEILSKYSEYEKKHRELTTFLDKNKKDGFRLYYRPYENDERGIVYCLCDIESSQKAEKLQPIILVLSQCSLWLGEENKSTTSQVVEDVKNLFAFVGDNNGYYSTKFGFDEKANEYCIEFYSGVLTEASLSNDGYNEVPLKIKIYGPCVNPIVSLFRQGENEPFRQTQIFANVDDDYYIEINANILENGVWYVNKNTNERFDYASLVNNEMGSPYFYIDNGNYVVKVKDSGSNVCTTDVFFQEEYSE